MKTYNNEIKYLKNIKKLLINIDMVNGFIKEGNLKAPNIMRIVPYQVKLLDEGLKNKDSGIFIIRDAHPINAVEFKTYPKHCLIGSNESELISELKKYEAYSKVYLKNSTSLIFAPNIQNDLLSLKNLQIVELMGCLSEICVLNGAIDLKNFFNQYNKDIDVCVHEKAIDTYNSKEHNADLITKNALMQMEANGIKVLRKENKRI